jgi:predicted amidohydrolase
VRVAAIQHDIAWENATATRERLRPAIAQAVAGGARLVVLSEMFATGFSMHPERIAEERGGPNEQFLADSATRNGIWLIGSVAQWVRSTAGERLAGNIAIVAGPEGQRHYYQKIHPFSYSGEHKRYEAGRDFLTVTIDDLRVSVFICYDLRFADEFWALANDTDLYVVPANWPEPRREHWRTLLRARAIENQAYVVGCNRIGAVGSLNHVGDSVIVDPLGRVLAEASMTETVLIADVTAAEVAKVRAEFPFLADRRGPANG